MCNSASIIAAQAGISLPLSEAVSAQAGISLPLLGGAVAERLRGYRPMTRDVTPSAFGISP